MTKFDLYENPQVRLWKEKYMQASKTLEALEANKRELELMYFVERDRWHEDSIRFCRCLKLEDDIAQFNALPWYKKMFFKFGNVQACNMTINGDISIRGNKVFVNSQPIEDLEQMEEKSINITVTGEVASLSVDRCDTIHVDGNVGKICTTSGDVEVSGRVIGDIQTTIGAINCADVTGDVCTTNGDVHCGRVKGGVSTMSGNIRHR